MKKALKKAIVAFLLFFTFALIMIACAIAGAFFGWAYLVDKMGLATGTWTMCGIMAVLMFVSYKIDIWYSGGDKKLTPLPRKAPPKGTIRVYISGKITGLPFETAYSKFEEGEQRAINAIKAVRPDLKIEIINPMKLAHRQNPDWVDFMAVDLEALMRCNAIYLLDNWKDSKGARIEHFTATETSHAQIHENEGDPSIYYLHNIE